MITEWVSCILVGLSVGLGFGGSMWLVRYVRRLITGVLVME